MPYLISLQYGPAMKDPNRGNLHIDLINTKWIQRFMYSKVIVLCAKPGKLFPLPEKKKWLSAKFFINLGTINLRLDTRELDEDCVFNSNETHFAVYLSNGRTLSMKEETNVTFVDVVSGDVGITMMVFLGGVSKAQMGLPFMIFKKYNCSCPIRGFLDNVPRFFNRTGPMGLIDVRVFGECLNEKRYFHHLLVEINWCCS